LTLIILLANPLIVICQQVIVSEAIAFEKAGNEKYEDYDFDGAINDYLKSLTVKS